MPARNQPTTIRLPQSLLQKISDSTGDVNHGHNPSRSRSSRKDARKFERTQIKQRRAEFFSTTPSASKRRAPEEHAESPKQKKAKTANLSPVKTSHTSSAPPQNSTQKPSRKFHTEDKNSRKSKKSVTVPGKSQRDEDEDAYIAYLESKLGYKPGHKSSVGDGLDDLLDLADSLATSNQLEQNSGNEPTPSDSDLDSEESEGSEWQGIGDASEAENEDWHGIKDDDLQSPPKPIPSVEQNAISSARYLPPQARTRHDDSGTSEDLVKLQRQLKGLLNRMSEQNLTSILDSVEELYRKHCRHDVTATLTTLILDGISSHSSLLDSYVVLYAAFVSSLHKVVGIEFAAYFVQNATAAYERYYQVFRESPTDSQQSDEANSGKECSNVIVLISELYNFQVISAILVFDVIRGLLNENLTEFNVELLLKIVRNSGQQLRQDDPSALKDIIQIVQSKFSNDDSAHTSRTRFMIETLTNLKNNKSKKSATENQGGEAVERMKKFLSGLSKKRHVLSHEPLRVSLEDLHSAESKGKWWLVGAAWGGDPLVDRRQESKSENVEDDDSNALMNLAKKQGMNTDIRRSIFIVLMSSDDYVDACDRLSQLNLTEVQQREIVRVLLHCCGNEKSYNPYYTLVGERLCRTSHSHKITLQYCLWDFLRDLGESTVGGAELTKNVKENDTLSSTTQHISASRLKNTAKAYAWWIARDCSSLLILKPVDFTVLQPRSKEFLEELLVNLFVSTQVTTPMIPPNWREAVTARDRAAIEAVFIKAARIQTLAMGLAYFISQMFGSSEADGLVKWAIEVAKDTFRTTVEVEV